MKELLVEKLLIEETPEPRLNETYLCLTSEGKLFICDYSYRYGFFGRKSKKATFRSRVHPTVKIKHIIAFMSIWDIHELMAETIRNEP